MFNRIPLTLAIVAAIPAAALAQPTTPTPAPVPPAMPTDPAPAPEATTEVEPTPDPAASDTVATTAAPADPGAPVDAPEAVVEEEAATEPAWYDTIMVNGFMSIAYSLNTNRPSDESNQLRVFDTDDGTINVDVIEVVVQKPVGDPGSAGFRVDLTAGSTIPAAAASAGLFRDADGNAQDFDLQQAFVSYVAKVGKGLRLDAGKFTTHMGYELIEGYDGYNDHYSRSILFGYAIPFTHTGVKASYPITDKVSGMLMVANGWDNVKDSNEGKTIGAQVAVAAGPANFWLNYVGGPEQAGNNKNFRHVVDVIATVKAADVVTLGLNADFGYEKDGAVDGMTMAPIDATWFGVAGYVKWDATDKVSLAGRGEIFNDADGARTTVAQTVVEGTISPTLKLGDNFVLRGDLRFDHSDQTFFSTSETDPSKNQVTIAINAIGLL